MRRRRDWPAMTRWWRCPGDGPAALLALLARDRAGAGSRAGRRCPGVPRPRGRRGIGAVRRSRRRARAGKHRLPALADVCPGRMPPRTPARLPCLAAAGASGRLAADRGSLRHRPGRLSWFPHASPRRRAGPGRAGPLCGRPISAPGSPRWPHDGAVNATRARHLSAVRSFFRYLARRHGLDNPAVRLVATPRSRRPVPRAAAAQGRPGRGRGYRRTVRSGRDPGA